MFIAATKIKFDKGMEEKIMDFSKRSLPIFKKQKRFISLRVHKAHDGSHLMTYPEFAAFFSRETVDILKFFLYIVYVDINVTTINTLGGIEE